MGAWIWYAVLKLWGVLSPLLGPLVRAGSLALPGLSLGPFVVPTLALVLGGFIAWKAYGALTAPARPALVSVDAVQVNRLEALLKAERAARAEAERKISEREASIEFDRRELEQLELDLEAERARSKESNPSVSVGVLPADDPWVRSKIKRRRP